MATIDEAVVLAVAAAEAADDKRGTDLTILEVAEILAVVDVFLLVTTASDRQLKAVAEHIEERLRTDHGRKPWRREGSAQGGWMLLDYGDLVCHVFSRDEREFYALDRLWSDVPHRDPATGRVLLDRVAVGAGAATELGGTTGGEDV